MKAVWTITLKEIHENLISLRFVLLFLLALALIPASLYTNYRSYLARLAEARQIEDRGREYLRQLKVVQVFTNPNFTIDVYWPPSPASVFASGVEESHPRHLVVGERSVEFGAPLDVAASALFGSVDYLFVVQFIFSLFAVLLSFDAITREKESGTLRSMLSNPVSRAAVGAGKLLGGYVTLAIPLLVAFMAGLAALAAAGLNVFAGDLFPRSAWILLCSLLYMAVFFLMGLLVSAITTSTYSALVVSLAFWLLAALVAPRAAGLASQLFKPVKSRQAVWLEKQNALAAIQREKTRAFGELQRRLPAGSDWAEQRKQVAVPFERKEAQAVKSIEEEYQRRRDEQRALGLTLSRLSPAGALASFITGMAQTGLELEERFLTQADRYREVLARELFSKTYSDVLPSGISMGVRGKIDIAALPQFQLRRPGVAESFLGADLAILLAWFVAVSGGIFVALARYDVR